MLFYNDNSFAAIFVNTADKFVNARRMKDGGVSVPDPLDKVKGRALMRGPHRGEVL